MLRSPPLDQHPVNVGQRTEAVIIAELVRRGFRVLLPFGSDQRYDLVLDREGEFVRVQCKTGRLRRGKVEFQAQSIRSNRQGTMRRSYTDEIELFIVYCPANQGLYAVPVEDATRSLCSLRVAPTANGQSKGVRWARDYELPA